MRMRQIGHILDKEGKKNLFLDLLFQDFADDKTPTSSNRQVFLKELACIAAHAEHKVSVSSLIDPRYVLILDPIDGLWAYERSSRKFRIRGFDTESLTEDADLNNIINCFLSNLEDRFIQGEGFLREPDHKDVGNAQQVYLPDKELLHGLWKSCVVAGLYFGDHIGVVSNGHSYCEVDLDCYREFSFNDYGTAVLMAYNPTCHGNGVFEQYLGGYHKANAFFSEEFFGCCDAYYEKVLRSKMPDFSISVEFLCEAMKACAENIVLFGLWIAYTEIFRYMVKDREG